MISKTSLILAMVSAYSSAYECYSNDHQITELEYWQGTDEEFPCMYAGTLKSNEEQTHNMFYWFYRNEDENPEAPLVIFLNGGPGCSSVFANFLMNGALRVTRTGDGVDDYAVHREEKAWSNAANMVFVDQPVGTGFSWGEPLLTNMDDAADEFVIFCLAFLEKYPEFKDKQLYLTGESYAGKYLPAFSYALLKHNEKVGERVFNLEATLIGDPYAQPITQRTSMHILPSALNVLDKSNMAQIDALDRKCEEIPSIDLEQGEHVCASIMDYIKDVSGDVYPYDQRIFGYDWGTYEKPLLDYFTISGRVEKIYEQIHVSDSTKDPVFEKLSSRVDAAFVMDNLINYTNVYEELLAMGLHLLVYAGEMDAQDGPKTIEPWIRAMDFEGKEAFWEQSRQVYYLDALAPVGSQKVGGYFRQQGNLSYLTIPKAGHYVPNNNYDCSFQFLTDYIRRDANGLACHADDCSVVDARCQAMNNCNSNGTCQANGLCQCDSGFKGADCSLAVEHVTADYSKDLQSQGNKWYTFAVSSDAARGRFSLRSDYPMDVYVSGGAHSDPNRFEHQMSFQDQKELTLSGHMTPSMHEGYSVAVWTKAVDMIENELFDNTLHAEVHTRKSKFNNMWNNFMTYLQ